MSSIAVSPVRIRLVVAALALVFNPSIAEVPRLPSGGTTSWEIRGPEEVVSFALFDPHAPGISLPAGLQFVLAREIEIPEVQEYLRRHPTHADWAFSIVEITRHAAFLIDGRGPALPANGGIGLWFAPVNPSGLAEEIDKDKFARIIAPAGGAVLGLGIWVPDREFVSYMRARGHHADYGMVTLLEDGTGAFLGEIRLDDLQVRASATPHGEAREEPGAETQLLFTPGIQVVDTVVLAGSRARHRDCTANWTSEGTHPLANAVIIGPTYLTTYDVPLTGSAYRLRD